MKKEKLELSSDVKLGIILVALVVIIGLVFCMVAISTGVANVSTEAVQDNLAMRIMYLIQPK